jgi:GT2 family glycosyltransferase
MVTPAPKGPHSRKPKEFHVIILSANPNNLRRCLTALSENEPHLESGRVIVVDDGARQAVEKEFEGLTWIPGIKPFNFARNCNLGIQWAATDVVLLNDDALLMTKEGFTKMSRTVHEYGDVGLCSAGIVGEVGNKNQRWIPSTGIRPEHLKLAFMAIYITKEAIDRVGLLDERFVDYGWEDDDFSLRARYTKLKLGVFDSCKIDHSHLETSSFRTKPDFAQLITNNRLRFEAKWRGLL